MPKPLLKQNIDSRIDVQTDFNSEPKQMTSSEKIMTDKLLRKPRSKEYMNALSKLDSGGHVHNKEQVDEIKSAIINEFPEIELGGTLLGYVSICYLGEPYEVHTLSLAGSIITHYKRGEALPNGMEKARSIALHGGYAFIEVYTDCCRAISSDGSVSVISC